MKKMSYLHLAIVAVLAFVVLRVVGVASGSLVVIALFAGCGLMMFFMMRSMGGNSSSDKHDHNSQHRM
jgi:hypothetical protein